MRRGQEGPKFSFLGWHCCSRVYSQIPDFLSTPVSKGWAVSTAAFPLDVSLCVHVLCIPLPFSHPSESTLQQPVSDSKK